MAALHRRRLRFLDSLFAMLQTGVTPSEQDVAAARADIKRALKSGAEVRRMSRERQAKRTATFADERGMVRAAVVTRAAGLCEGCGHPLCIGEGELDEFFGGVGRRRQMMSIETCWLLHPYCHRAKTENINPLPAGFDGTLLSGSVYWARKFIAHARANGYEKAAQLAERRLP